MTSPRRILRGVRRAVVLVLALGLVAATGAPAPLDGFARFVREDGSFRSPAGPASDGLVHLGSWFVPEGEAAGFHHVRTQPEAIDAYRRSGAFPDGTVLVKEIVTAKREDLSTGARVASATETRQWFLMVKDARGRFPGDPLWGRGWGWALFDAKEPSRNVATSLERDCLGCHAPAHATDWIYVGGYPALSSLGEGRSERGAQ